jgi:hypothetical protein
MSVFVRDVRRNVRTYLTLVLFYVNLVAENDEREVLGVVRARLYKELIPPAVESLETL